MGFNFSHRYPAREYVVVPRPYHPPKFAQWRSLLVHNLAPDCTDAQLFDLLKKSRRAAGGASGRDARLRALEERGSGAGQNADDSAELVPIPDASGCVRMRPGCVGILNSSEFRRILAKFRQNPANFDKNWQR